MYHLLEMLNFWHSFPHLPLLSCEEFVPFPVPCCYSAIWSYVKGEEGKGSSSNNLAIAIHVKDKGTWKLAGNKMRIDQKQYSSVVKGILKGLNYNQTQCVNKILSYISTMLDQ